MYINDLPGNVLSTMKLFTDDSSLFTRVTDVSSSHIIIEKDLKTISDWSHQWKMFFNPDITKQAVEVIFPPIIANLITPSCYLTTFLLLGKLSQNI